MKINKNNSNEIIIEFDNFITIKFYTIFWNILSIILSFSVNYLIVSNYICIYDCDTYFIFNSEHIIIFIIGFLPSIKTLFDYYMKSCNLILPLYNNDISSCMSYSQTL